MKIFLKFILAVLFTFAVSSFTLYDVSEENDNTPHHIFLIAQTGFWDASSGSQINLASTLKCPCGTQGLAAYIHGGPPRNGIVTGYVGFHCVTNTDTLYNNQLDLAITANPNRTTKFEFDIDAFSAPQFQLKGFYLLPNDTTHVPISSGTFSGTIISFTLPPCPSGIYYMSVSGFSSSSTGGYALYSVRIRQ